MRFHVIHLVSVLEFPVFLLIFSSYLYIYVYMFVIFFIIIFRKCCRCNRDSRLWLLLIIISVNIDSIGRPPSYVRVRW